MTPTGNPIQDQSDRTHVQAMETAAMAGWLLLYGAWQGAWGGPTRPEAELMLECYARTLEQKQAAWDGLRPDDEVEQLRREHAECREAILLAIREPFRTVPPLGYQEARSMLRDFETAARTAEREGFGLPGEINLAQRECDNRRHDIEAVLAGTPDFRELYLSSENEAEGLACELSSLKSALREAGPGIDSAHELRCAMDSLRGEVLAAEVRRDELAAFVLQLMEHLKSFPTNDMNSGLEMQHHSIVASPRSAETEAVSNTLLQERVEKLYATMVEQYRRREEEILAESSGLRNDANLAKTQLSAARDVSARYLQEADMRYQRLGERHQRMLNISCITMGIQGTVIAALAFAPAIKSLLGF